MSHRDRKNPVHGENRDLDDEARIVAWRGPRVPVHFRTFRWGHCVIPP